MPRHAIDLEPHRLEIEIRVTAGHTIAQVLHFLQTTHHVRVGKATLERRLRDWGISVYRRRDATEDEALRERIVKTFWDCDRSIGDKETLEMLRLDGYTLSLLQLRKLRRGMGLMRKVPKEQRPHREAAQATVSSLGLDPAECQGPAQEGDLGLAHPFHHPRLDCYRHAYDVCTHAAGPA